MKLQVKSTVINLLIILIGAPLLGSYMSYLGGEIHGFADWWIAVKHGGFGAFMMAIGWLFLKSPASERIMEILRSTTRPDGTQTVSSLKLSEPAEPTRTASVAVKKEGDPS